MELFGGALYGIPAVGIGRDLLAHGAAQQAVDRLVERLAHDIPAGHLDQGDASHRRFRRPAKITAEHLLHQPLDFERIRAQDVARHRFVEVALQGFLIQRSRLADPEQPFVGFDL